MQRIQIFLISTAIISILSCQHNPVFDNELDPSSNNFNSIFNTFSNPILPINNFDQGDFNKPNIWGRTDDAYFYRDNGTIVRSYVNKQPLPGGTGYAYKLDFNVSYSPSSAAGWTQILGDNNYPEIGAFNAKCMCLKSLSFWIRGEKGGEIFGVVLADDSVCTDPPVKSTNIGFNVTIDWQEISFPLEILTKNSSGNNVNLTRLQTILILFSGWDVTSGTVYIDNLAFKW